MVDLILHPGHSKCGSTTIQNFIFKNRNVFKKRGIWIPDYQFNFPCDSDYNPDMVHTPRDYFAELQSGSIPLENLEIKLERFISHAEKAGCRRVIVSAENLINGLASQCTKNIHRLFNNYFDSVKIVYYVRRQDKFLVSAWQQWGHKAGESLSEYVEKVNKTKAADFFFNAKQLRLLYPEAKLNVWPIDKKVLEQGSLVRDFAKRALINIKGLELDIPSSNLGLSSEMCLSLSKISTIYQNIHDQRVKSSIEELTPHSQHLHSSKDYQPLSNDDCQKIEQRYQVGNQRLAKNFFPKINFDDVMSLKPVLKDTNGEFDLLHKRLSSLENLCSIQLDMILSLKAQLDEK